VIEQLHPKPKKKKMAIKKALHDLGGAQLRDLNVLLGIDSAKIGVTEPINYRENGI
jgi:hypothetical protein